MLLIEFKTKVNASAVKLQQKNETRKLGPHIP